MPSQLDEVSMNNIYFIPRVEVSGGMTYNDFFALLPWKEGTISKETMEWTLPTPTLDPTNVAQTQEAVNALSASGN